MFSRTRLAIWEQIYKPNKASIVKYKGKNTGKMYKKTYELIKNIFNVPTGYIQEKSYNWEQDNGRERFSVKWQIDKNMDKYSYLQWNISLKGYESKGKGEAEIEIEPILITEYPQDTFLQQSILYEILRRIWHVTFYEKKREEFFELGKSLTDKFENSVKDYFEKLKKS